LTTRRPGRELLAAIGFSAWLFVSPCSSATPGAVRTVVVLVNPESPSGIQFNQSFRATFAADTREYVQLRPESLDLSRFPDPAGRELVATFLQQKYAGQKIDLVVPVVTPSLDFVLEYGERIFPGVPIVFAAIDEEDLRTRTLPADVIGVPTEMDLVGTLEFALRLQPEIRRVFVVAGRSSFDARWEAAARQRFRPYEGRLEFVYLSGLPMGDLLKQVANLPAQSIVQYLHIGIDGTGQIFAPAEALRLLAARANAPIYSHVGSYIGYGVVGGHTMSFELAGKNAASLGLRILAGERPETMARPDVSSNEYVVDWRQLRRWGISGRSLPAGTVVRHREPSAWDLYRWHIVGIICLFVLETALIVALLLQMARHRKAKQDLRLSQVDLRRLTGRLIQAQEDESRRIARELHDDLGQRLALLTVDMDLLRQKLPEAAGMPELLGQIRQLSSSVHELSHQLHPAKLEQLGLGAAIGGLCRELTHHHGFTIKFTDNEMPSAISQEVALCLYRIAQEALANAIKHSGAELVQVELSATAAAISLRIVDDGTGFDTELIQDQEGLGLVSMRERVLHLRGQLTIDSQPSRGTRLHARVPLQET
jgi:signal transduction histidine kinase/ABC-type uncharacterized transport system substrate-binding protein